MIITVNGKATTVHGEITLSQLIDHLSLNADTIVIEHNGLIIDKSSFETTTVVHGDLLEIIHFVGGG